MDLSAHQGEIPIPITSTYAGGSHGQPPHAHAVNHDAVAIPLLHQPPNVFAPPPLSVAEEHPQKRGLAVKYRECLKNHAASLGGNATDRSGEFMPSGAEGSLEALKCSACSCHRNFHRKEVEGELPPCGFHLPIRRGKVISHQGGGGGLLIPRPPSAHMVMPLGALHHTSESDDMEGGAMARPGATVKKRFRTRFTPEQKEKMLQFAERAGWRLQKQEESVVQQFCQEVGVKRRVLKVWMHNNKHNLAKKGSGEGWARRCPARARARARARQWRGRGRASAGAG